jgi:hypothetical protein
MSHPTTRQMAETSAALERLERAATLCAAYPRILDDVRRICRGKRNPDRLALAVEWAARQYA